MTWHRSINKINACWRMKWWKYLWLLVLKQTYFRIWTVPTLNEDRTTWRRTNHWSWSAAPAHIAQWCWWGRRWGWPVPSVRQRDRRTPALRSASLRPASVNHTKWWYVKLTVNNENPIFWGRLLFQATNWQKDGHLTANGEKAETAIGWLKSRQNGARWVWDMLSNIYSSLKQTRAIFQDSHTLKKKEKKMKWKSLPAPTLMSLKASLPLSWHRASRNATSQNISRLWRLVLVISVFSTYIHKCLSSIWIRRRHHCSAFSRSFLCVVKIDQAGNKFRHSLLSSSSLGHPGVYQTAILQKITLISIDIAVNIRHFWLSRCVRFQH